MELEFSVNDSCEFQKPVAYLTLVSLRTCMTGYSLLFYASPMGPGYTGFDSE